MVEVYDKAKWHFEGAESEGFDGEQAFVHTGLFIGWLIDRNLLYVQFINDMQAEDEIEQFRSRQLTGPKLFEMWDGVLTDDIFSNEGNAFAGFYFDLESGQYLTDYEGVFNEVPSTYGVPDTWESYERIKARIDQRYLDWKKPKMRRWWQFK